MPDAPVDLTVTPAALQTCTPGSFDVYFDALWDCSESVLVYGTTEFLRSNVDNPVDDWDNALDATGVNGPPEFTPTEVSGHFLTSAFGAGTRTVQVSVTPQPPAALVIQDIEINTGLPITSAGTYTWTATLGSGDPSGITFRWVFEYSDNSPPDSVFIPARSTGDTVPPWIQPSPYTGAAAGQSRDAHAGDYTIWVKVWPIRDGVAGSPAAREFSVCTGGPALRATPEEGTKEPPPGNEAVGGCPPS